MNTDPMLRLGRLRIGFARGIILGPFFDHTWNVCGCRRWWVGRFFIGWTC